MRGVERVLDTLDDFLSFAVDPSIALYQVQCAQSGAQLAFECTLSFNYPLPWRPRVSVSSRTTMTLSTAQPPKVTEITDELYVTPLTLVSQALPKLTDIFWLYPSPHAETDRGQRRQLRKKSSYVLFNQAPVEQFRVCDTVKRFEHELIWAMPALPPQAFQGGLRKLEQYSASSPVALRLADGENVRGDGELLYEWAIPLPTSLTGSSQVMARIPDAKGTRIVDVPRSLMAACRFDGFSTRTRVKEEHQKLLEALVDDGILSGDEEQLQFGGPNVWVRCYDCKVGFNSKGVLSMAMYGGSRGVRRVNEIVFDLTDIVAEQSVCA
ncbi:SOUL heme-binding protein [Gracilaria domingensis]|nr:SOUL heme-binding protein [Gracilaria domingensis]